MSERPRTILLVEDDPNDMLFMKTAFEAVGLENAVHEVSDGKQAMAYLGGTGSYSDRRKFPLPYLVLMDLKLPYVMGLDLLKWIRERRELDSTMVIVLSASANPKDVDAAYRLGANGYLMKTSRFDTLKAMVQALHDYWLIHNRAGSPFSN